MPVDRAGLRLGVPSLGGGRGGAAGGHLRRRRLGLPQVPPLETHPPLSHAPRLVSPAAAPSGASPSSRFRVAAQGRRRYEFLFSFVDPAE